MAARRKQRRRRKNPSTATLVVVGGGVALVAGVVAIAVVANQRAQEKNKTLLTGSEGTQFAQGPAFTGGLPTAEGLLPNDCIVVVQGQAGFRVAGDVPNGENTLMKVQSSGGRSATSVVAVSIDPRVTSSGPFTVPTRAVSGGGDCGALA